MTRASPVRHSARWVLPKYINDWKQLYINHSCISSPFYNWPNVTNTKANILPQLCANTVVENHRAIKYTFTALKQKHNLDQSCTYTAGWTAP